MNDNHQTLITNHIQSSMKIILQHM